MKKSILFLLSLMILAVTVPQGAMSASKNSQVTAGEKFSTVTPQEADALIKNQKNLLLVDLRNPDELGAGYIEGSTFIPMWEIVKGKRSIPKDRPVMLICAVGGRSLGLGQLMVKYGWPEVYNLKGGIDAWREAGLPLKHL